MSDPSVPIALTARLAMLASISFGGFSSVLPDVRDFVVFRHDWMTDREFVSFFALAQAIPGPNMILMMSFIGWKVWGIPGAVASAFATFGPPCAMYFLAHRVWDRLLASRSRGIIRTRLVPVTAGLVIAGGVVMAGAADAGWAATTVTIATALLALRTRLTPIVMLVAGGFLGGLGLL